MLHTSYAKYVEDWAEGGGARMESNTVTSAQHTVMSKVTMECQFNIVRDIHHVSSPIHSMVGIYIEVRFGLL